MRIHLFQAHAAARDHRPAESLGAGDFKGQGGEVFDERGLFAGLQVGATCFDGNPGQPEEDVEERMGQFGGEKILQHPRPVALPPVVESGVPRIGVDSGNQVHSQLYGFLFLQEFGHVSGDVQDGRTGNARVREQKRPGSRLLFFLLLHPDSNVGEAYSGQRAGPRFRGHQRHQGRSRGRQGVAGLFRQLVTEAGGAGFGIASTPGGQDDPASMDGRCGRFNAGYMPVCNLQRLDAHTGFDADFQIAASIQ